MPLEKFTVVGLGEVLWDLLPTGARLGGAPANFVYMIDLLGDEGVIASRVGNDELGFEAKQRLERLTLQSTVLQTDSQHPTGTVTVLLNGSGEPTYQIAESVAWDFLEWTDAWNSLAYRASAVCFGSLAQRSVQSRRTIRRFLDSLRPGTLRIFDVNLRQSFYSAEILSQSIRLADILKLNAEELLLVAEALQSPHDGLEGTIRRLRDAYALKLVCVTFGPEGSLLVSENASHAHPGFPARVVDTVGAGDAFTAGLVYHYLRGSSLEEMNIGANRLGAWVAAQSGAMPSGDPPLLERIS